MADQIRTLIVDDIPETRTHLAKLLSFESDIEVVGSAASGVEAIELAESLNPDVILMDINMPDMDGIQTTEHLSTRAPMSAVVMMSVQGEADYLRRSMLAGAREFLVKPFSSDELTASIRQVYGREREKLSRMSIQTAAQGGSTNGTTHGDGDREPGRVIAVFSPKGGVGRTTIAVNLGVAAASLGKKTVVMDASFQFGDVGVLLNLNPKNKSIAEAIADLDHETPESMENWTIGHSSGVKVLLAPPGPEQADLVTPQVVKRVIELLRASHELVIVDCTTHFSDTTLAVLDAADSILTVLSLEITSIKNMRLFLEVAEQLGYDRNKVRLVLNRADSTLGIRVADVESSIGRKIEHTIVSDGRSVVYALNRGIPFVISNREAQVSQDILRLATSVAGEQQVVAAGDRSKASAADPKAAKKSLFAWR